MTDAAISIVLPVGEPEEALEGVLRSYVEVLAALGRGWEILLVPHGRSGSEASYERLSAIGDGIRVCEPAGGWGAAVRAGLNASAGEVLCYTNWQRTSAAALSEMLDLALRNPDLVLRANRRTRDRRIGRLGSLVFNIECRLLLQIPAWDVNGTPKVFPRAFNRLLELKREDDLFDAEFALVCERAGYPVVEVPIDAALLSLGPSGPDYRAALRMYLGVARLRAHIRG